MTATPPPDRPDFAQPDFEACYRHPDRRTGIRCQRCGKPICGECMNPASVGFQCPQCVGRGRTETRAPRTAYGGRLASSEFRVTTVLMIVVGAVWLLDFATRGQLVGVLAQVNYLIAQGQVWRLVTSGFTSGGLLSTLFTLFVLFVVGRALETMLGGWRFLATYLISAIGAATVLFVAGPYELALVGAGGSVIGLLAANAAIKLRRREDIKPDLVLLVLLVGINFVLGSPWGGLAQLGGAVTGLLVGLVLAYAPRSQRTQAQLAGLAGVLVLCAVAVAAKIIVG